MIIFLGKVISDNTIKLLDSEVQHCVKTLRKQIGDEIVIHDGSCFRIIVNNDGGIESYPVTCP